MSAVFWFIALVAVVFFGVALLFVRNGSSSEKRKDEMMKAVYYYGVLFTTLLMIIGGSVFAFMAIADIVSPPPYYQSFEEYKQIKLYNAKDGAKQQWTEEQLRQSYEQELRHQEAQHRQRAVNNLIKSLGWIVVPLPIFIAFQRRIKAGKTE